MTGVTSIQENHYTEEEEEEESTWKTIQSHLENTHFARNAFQTQRLLSTREKETDIVLEIPLWQYAVIASAPGVHPSLEEDCRRS